MFNTISKGLRLFAGTMIAATFVLQASAADAQTRSQQGRDKGQYIPTIWVDMNQEKGDRWQCVFRVCINFDARVPSPLTPASL